MKLPHRSAVVFWSCWCLAALASAVENPRLEEDVADLSASLWPIAGAVVLFLVAVSAFQREMGLALASASFGTPERLVTSGSFARSRNPIYLAAFVPLASLAVYSVPGALLGVALYWAAMTAFVIRPEEAELRRLFGARFETYARTTPRWIALPKFIRRRRQSRA